MQQNSYIPTPDANSVFTMSQTHADPSAHFWVIGLIVLLVIAGLLVLRWYLRTHPGMTAAAVELGSDPLAPERERVLKLLDAGKITAQESADLLNALGHATPPRPLPQASNASKHRKLALVGGALLLLGFFLPWFSLNVGKELSHTMDHMQQALQSPFGVQFAPHLNMDTGTTNIAGGDIAHGLGWIVLLLGLGVAVLPYIAANLDPGTLRKAGLVGLGIGTLILLYLLSDLIRYVNIGIFLVLAGYVLEFIGTLRERPTVQR